MKRIIPIITGILLNLSIQAQQKHFVFIQTENKQPFSVRVGDKILSSSSSGYVVIPKLNAGAYDLNFGFPKNEWPNQHIQLVLDKDMGFVLKNFDGKGWGLFNIQTMAVVMNDNNGSATPAKPQSNDGFADALADVVGSPSIKSQPKPAVPAKNPEPKEEPVPQVPGKSNEAPATVVNETKANPGTEKKAEENKAAFSPPQKINSFLDQSGRSAVYVDTSNGENDTIRIFIPYPEVANEEEKKEVPVPEPVKPAAEPVKDQPLVTTPVVNDPDLKTSEVINKQEPAEESRPKVVIMNSDCKSNASESDFLKLRSKMAAQKSEENMIIMAQKDFNKRCYSTEQVANLSVLLLTDKGRYSFFDAAYPHVSDTGNFGTLASRLTDEYYKNRFLAMIRH